ncbi:cobalt-precorrin-5B (C(1))-methyltransferase [Pseudanabaena sp. FACHB-1998]|uniref:cobalt-precorrin-5B (C(1))-methyltransferase CbiD n=1 Tax=Pseudanabaena sp. FACHB-1998 TaxID=2692858 RepID=UPI0016803684|nr:cobalt-precorrin-5B (C(1))-methyltransferase CbiD [Pseudanabaena sp. FACHB-1998]MBD2175926.1 cobalt-precorrin-5B (C(1))-methyltransferase [Pseudanabaena sp. FACHB-1998]
MKSGYTLPVFAIAAAKAAILALSNQNSSLVKMDLLEAGIGEIAIAQSAVIDQNTALAIAISDPGDNLDLTAGTPVWAWVSLEERPNEDSSQLILEAGEGLGRTAQGEPAIYQLAKNLAEVNLIPLLSRNISARVRFILPEGKAIAKRTSNAAFGIFEGLSLLGTSAISKPLSVEEKLDEFREDLQKKAAISSELAFYIGANGYQVAQNLEFETSQLVQTANWVGAMLVEAALLGVTSITLVGYHGKLLKLAGGIFNTSSHLADARIDILVRAAVHVNLSLDIIQRIEKLPTAEAIHQLLVEQDCDRPVFEYLTQQITQRAAAYIHKYTDRQVKVRTILCDRLGKLVLS